jgi:hypothetical protein
MLKIKVFTAKNVQQYGLSDGEIEELNAEWERKASGLGLDQHLPEYWQEAKRHMEEKLEGRVVETIEESGKPLDGEPIELPSLDVNLDDFDIAAGPEITAAAFSDGETLAEVVPEELPDLESISIEELEPEAFSAGQVIQVAERVEDLEQAAVAAATGEAATEQAEAAEMLTTPVAEMADAGAAGEKIIPGAEPELQAEDAAQQPEIAAEKPVHVYEEGDVGPAAGADFMSVPQGQDGKQEGRKKESFFAKMIARLKKSFKL